MDQVGLEKKSKGLIIKMEMNQKQTVKKLRKQILMDQPLNKIQRTQLGPVL